MAIVRAISDAIVDLGEPGGRPDPTAIKTGRPYDEDDLVVQRFPELFSFDNVEEASARPGERRNVRRTA